MLVNFRWSGCLLSRVCAAAGGAAGPPTKRQRGAGSGGIAAQPAALGHGSLPNVPPTWDSFDSLDYFEVNVDPGSAEYKWLEQVLRNPCIRSLSGPRRPPLNNMPACFLQVLSKTVESLHQMNEFNHKVLFRKLKLQKVRIFVMRELACVPDLMI